MANVDPTTGGTPAPRAPKVPQSSPRVGRTIRVKAHTRTIRPKHNAQPKPPADPYGAQVRAATDVKYGPLLAGDESQIASSAANALRVGNWYQQAQQQAIQNAQNQRQAAVNLAGQLNAQREVLPAGASPEAAAAAASRGNVGQAFGAQMGLIGQNQANFLQGLGTAQGLAGQQAQGAESQHQGQLREKYAQDRSSAGEYGTVLRGQLQAAADKAAMDQANLQVKQGTLAYLTGNAASEAANRVAGQKVARSNVRIKRAALAEKTATDNAAIRAKAEAQNANGALKRSQFIAKYGLPPEQVQKMTPGQLSNFAKKNPRFTGFRAPARGNGSGTNSPFTGTQVRSGQKSLREAIKTINTYGLQPGDAGTLDAFGIKDPLLGKVAMLLAHHGALDPKTLKGFQRAYGFDPSRGY